MLGLSVPPKEGSALFWFNLDSAGFLDTRNYHLGCPGPTILFNFFSLNESGGKLYFYDFGNAVLYGNKWIANKWVHWHAQMHEYPCYVKTKAYPIYTNWIKVRSVSFSNKRYLKIEFFNIKKIVSAFLDNSLLKSESLSCKFWCQRD